MQSVLLNCGRTLIVTICAEKKSGVASVYCQSVTFSPSLFLDKTKVLPHIRCKTHWSFCTFTDFAARLSCAPLGVRHFFRHHQICISEGTISVRDPMVDVVPSSLLAALLRLKNGAFCPVIILTRLVFTTTWRHFFHPEIDGTFKLL